MELALPEPCLTLPSLISSRGSDWDKIIRFPILEECEQMSTLQWDRGQGELLSISGKGCDAWEREGAHISPHLHVGSW